ncbi:hypothetical protein [Legionella israelensis]|uniref:Leucine-rich repeat-containing protein n=1 Tax=Legionella israelensis TaxID=454 RepID=A0A0W0WNK4_9GAMM|nr:hypothetical protein [Legionella israelensis]KTD33880.1 leucine-rich repeat-containing protein [Legionella israelensis]QBS08953.1 hypothetical protein E4T55_03205 [Legionella israelensis]SCX81794.1 hypothetical protein SAMN02746069_00318 [Legionella israelensis DSM 19235]STX58645.1 leucine-rich repeat-containing protein [Legionella israelensis]
MKSSYKVFDTIPKSPKGTYECCWRNLPDDPQQREECINILANISDRTIDSLDISGNKLGECSLDFIYQVLDLIGKTSIKLSSINLSFNKFGHMKAKELCNLIKKIPISVHSVNFTHNELHRFTHDELMALAKAFPKTIKVDFSYNSLPENTNML